MAISGRLFRRWLPPDLVRLAGPYLGWGVRFSGNYTSWEDAVKKSAGYSSAQILDRVKAAVEEAVGTGGRKFERDGIVLVGVEPPYPLLTALLRAAIATRSGLGVLDFGGSLGSTFFQCRPYLNGIRNLRWNVVDQPNFVAYGKERLENESLRFFHSIEEAVLEARPDVILFSGVLQYLAKPLEVMQKAVDIGSPSIVIDRTPIVGAPENRIAIQKVPTRLGGSSYPIWLFTRERLLAPFLSYYSVLTEYAAVDGVMSYGWKRVEFKGFILDKVR